MAEDISDSFRAPVWRWPGDAAWHFVTLPGALADDIRARARPGGFGSVKVTATIGSTTWGTSLFPDSASGSYVLPVKAAVRRTEGLSEGSPATVHLVVHI